MSLPSVAWALDSGERTYLSLWHGVRPLVDLRTMREIADDICAEHRIGIRDMLGDGLHNRVSWARQHFMAVAYGTGRWSLPEIGRFLGRDHTTVLYGIRAHARRVAA